MIEFNGYLSGNAKKHFLRKSARIFSIIWLVAVALIFPPVVSLALEKNEIRFVIIYLLVSSLMLVLLYCRAPKQKQKMVPKKIFLKDDTITCVSDTYTESKFIELVKVVRDYGEFYELVFPFGNVSEKFICQKDLITVGELSDFEKIFADKIVRIKTK